MRDDLMVLDPFTGEPTLIAELADASLFHMVRTGRAHAWGKPSEIQRRGLDAYNLRVVIEVHIRAGGLRH